MKLSIRFTSYFIIAFMMLTGCKTLLAPEYDKAIVESINSNSTKVLTFLSSITNGTEKENFKKRENTYNELIGAFDALKLIAKARPLPKNIATKKINDILAIRGSNSLSGDYPSAYAFEWISKTLIVMKNKDMKDGLKPTAIEGFKNQIEVFLDQALTYESFLKR